MNILKNQREFTLDAQKEMVQKENENFTQLLSRRQLVIASVFSQAQILSLTPTKGMFVPCDREGRVLTKPDTTCTREGSNGECQCGEEAVKDCRDLNRKWLEAERAVRFKGFRVEKLNGGLSTITNGVVNIFWHSVEKGWYLSHGIKILEDIVEFKLELTTPTS